ncbi:MAG: Asp-tRNA(Asn)/Glu-tRNA(Gln) amidotransferase subunit GatA [Planctomycetia bacterium]|nr:MAG: Asp-tRNA(Asn)/Glu-tRNA(Gln) amidotransferase subunit GatA [Planctomycetota bacterium]KAB2948232.1 MAG: Asp-tRNA(Asn)/Glu-tRNA(Gln) amidotransferase subunit GatA [Phycisphaerae bacterium]MBE7457861.1 Asp-tRNA(Asn)/Glu-tRNA(Gln) amidotransferase subunit GatA [Planctomycetia bacterium]MCQ3921490.1 Asp-tRNA(Asn)/Glu-tRNA(Gln) amidotransferase GatCAB subunit A [Planctomycetota bacterium]NUQ08969.1 Asp-tRNA(Asn)/Glu-tRNA(Gln) amidotransferase subunit GatA [Phycisphaerae bacterium]
MLTVFETAEGVRRGRVPAEDVMHDCLKRISAAAEIRAFLHVDAERSLAAARRIDEARSRGEALGPLCGVPIAVKDNLCTSFAPTTCGSAMLAGFSSLYDAEVVRRLERAGAIVVGKTNLDEFAMGSSTENSAFGPTRNPWDPKRVPGGSSGGSAAAVAARLVPAALGSDTGGSIRQPAALCGVTGLKPGYGRVSRFGLVAFGSSLDQVGPIATDARDAALLMNILAGPDARDSTTAPDAPPDYAAAIDAPIDGLSVGLPHEYFGEGLSAEVRAAVHGAIDVLRTLGARTKDITLPHTEYAAACYYLVAPAEASSNLARFDGLRYGRRAGGADLIEVYKASRGQGLGAEVKRRIMIGTHALSSGYYDAYYDKASRVRTLIRGDFERAFSEVDVIAGPVTPTTAFCLGEKASDPLAMYLSDVYTIPANLAGICGISVPCGFDARGLPIGLQLMGPVFGEARLLQTAHQFQLATDYHRGVPPAFLATEAAA